MSWDHFSIKKKSPTNRNTNVALSSQNGWKCEVKQPIFSPACQILCNNNHSIRFFSQLIPIESKIYVDTMLCCVVEMIFGSRLEKKHTPIISQKILIEKVNTTNFILNVFDWQRFSIEFIQLKSQLFFHENQHSKVFRIVSLYANINRVEWKKAS